MKTISLTRGLFAIVDDEEHERLSQWKWHAMPNGSGQFYAARRSRISDGRRPNEPQKLILMHRLIASVPIDLVTDHINGDTLDNRRSNLRCATHTQNMQNRAKKRRSASRFKGVTWDRERMKWVAVLQADSTVHFLGRFEREEDAGLAYAAAAERFFGEFNRQAERSAVL